MAFIPVRHCSLFVKGKKIGEFEGVDYDYESGDEAQFGDEGLAGYSEGASQTTVSANGFMPLSGNSFDFYSALENKEDLDIAVTPIAGRVHQITMRLLSVSVKSTAKNGAQTGTFKFGGGKPRIV